MRKSLSIAAAICTIWSGAAWAQTYPTREIKLICGFAAGSGADVMYRYIAEKLQTLAGKPVLVENRPGVQGHLAHATVARAKPDGYTLTLQGGSAFGSISFILKNPPVDPMKDFDYIGTVLRQGWYLTVDAKSPIKTVAELTASLKAKGAKGSYAVSTNTGVVFAELYKAAAGLETVKVNYKTIGDSMNDLSAGSVDMAMSDPPFTIANVRAGRVRALAVSTGARVSATPDIPTMAEAGVPGIDVDVWWSVQGPAGMPAPVRDQLAKWFAQILTMEDTKKFFAGIGTDTIVATPEETRAMIVKDVERWREWAKRAKIDPI